MKHLLILFFLLTTNAFAQGPLGDYAVVKDKDGYVNIRAKENVKSKIVGTLPNNTLVYEFLDEEFNPSNWVHIDSGYVHKSRLKMISEFPSIGKGKEQGNSITIAGKGISVTLTKQPFDKTKHKITKKKHKEYSEYIIDGKRVQGLDNDEFLPKDHYKSITVTINGKNVPIPKRLMMICMRLLFGILTILRITMRKMIYFILLHIMEMGILFMKYAGK